MSYVLHLLVYFNIFAILAISLNLVTGYLGLVSLSHAVFFGIGAYAYAIATVAWGWTFIPAVCLAVVLAILMSLPLSIASWRFRGAFFILVSLAFQVMCHGVVRNWYDAGASPGSLNNLTNGVFGIAAVPRPVLGGLVADSNAAYAIFSLMVFVAMALSSHLLMQSPWGRLLRAMRDDELATAGLGKPVRLAKCQLFAISSGMAAVAGVLYAGYVTFVDPTLISLDLSLLLLGMVIIGGLGRLRGAITGAFLLLAIFEVLQLVAFSDTAAAHLRMLLYGFMMVLVVHFRPQGVAGVRRLP